MSEIDQRHDPMVLLGVIAEQNQALERVIAERDELRAHLESLGERLDALACLQRVYNNPKANETHRIKAAAAALGFERPKLSVTATTSVPLFDLLEARRRRGKTIDHAPALNGTGEPAQHDPTTTDAPALDMAGVDPPAA